MEKDTEPSEEIGSLKRDAEALRQEVKKLRLGHAVLLKVALKPRGASVFSKVLFQPWSFEFASSALKYEEMFAAKKGALFWKGV